LCQTKLFDNIYFVDDGVGDCKHLHYDINYVFRETNLGVVENFNDMLSRVESDYVMFLGADNWLRPDALELLSNSEADIITYDIMVTGELREEIAIPYKDDCTWRDGDVYWKREMKHHGSMLYNVKLAKKVGGYADNKTSLRTDEDLNLWDKMISEGASVSYVPQALLYYRRHKSNFYKYGI